MTKLRRFGLSKCCWGAGPQGIVVCVKYTLFKYDLQSTDSRHEVHFFFKLLSPWLGTYCHLVRESTRPVKNVLGIYWQFHSRKLSLVNISVEELKVLDWHLIVFQKDSHCHNRKRNMYIRDHWLGSTKREPISATESLLSIPCRSCHWPSFILGTNCPSEKGVREEITYLRRAIRLTNTSFRYKFGA